MRHSNITDDSKKIYIVSIANILSIFRK